MKRIIRYIWKRLTGKFVQDALEHYNFQQFEMELKEHYLRGYIFHQKEVEKDPELYNWIVKESYIEQ